MSRVVIVGASVGGVKTAQALRAIGHTGEIVLVESEAIARPYDKPPLSKGFLNPESTLDSIALVDDDDIAAIDAQLIFGVSATSLNPVEKRLYLADGTSFAYDFLVLATGARARPSPWGTGPGMHVLRTSDDAERLRAEIRPGRRLLIIGAGFIGAEVAATAANAGVNVTMVDPLPAPMSRAINNEIGIIFGEKHRAEGVRTILGQNVSSIERSPTGVFTVRLSDGEAVSVDAILVGIGAIVNTEWLEDSGLVIQNGILCSPELRAVGVDDVFAVGDVCRWYETDGITTNRLEHWTNAVDQARVVAHNIVESTKSQHYLASEYVWSDQFDWKIQVVGRTASSECELIGSAKGGRFAVTYSTDGKTLTGAVIVNWPKALVMCRRGVSNRDDAKSIRRSLACLLESAPVKAQ